MSDAAPDRAKPGVHPIGPADRASVCAMLGRSFFDDPVMMHFLPDADVRRAKLHRVFQILLKLGLPYGACFVTDGCETAALWRPPNQWHVPFWQYIVNAPALLGVFGAGVINVMTTMDMVEKLHPKKPHWYLQVLGTDPAKQGKGFASVIMRKQLAVADEQHLPCYLESSKSTNIPVYRAFGFEVTGEIVIPNGPTLWPMWREARA